jgi:hypothetical protein
MPRVRLTLLFVAIVPVAACRSAPSGGSRIPAPGPRPTSSPEASIDARATRGPDCIALDSLQRIRRASGIRGAPLGSLTDSAVQARARAGTRPNDRYPEFDVVLDIPNLCVDRISLAVDSLSARVELDARLANLLRIRAGADVRIGNVDLTIKGLEAQALLLVDLDNVVYAIDQTLTFVDNHPEMIRQLVGVADAAARDATAGSASMRGSILGRTAAPNGQTVVRTVTDAGRLIELTLSPTGQVVAERAAGSVVDLPTISESPGTVTDRVLRQVWDQATGLAIEFTLDRAASRVSGARVVRQPPAGSPG